MSADDTVTVFRYNMRALSPYGVKSWFIMGLTYDNGGVRCHYCAQDDPVDSGAPVFADEYEGMVCDECGKPLGFEPDRGKP